MAYHTYDFLKKRKKDPKWRDDYLIGKYKRILAFLLILNCIVWFFALTK